MEACITTLTVLKLLSGDPAPDRSAHLFYPQVDPYPKDGYVEGQTKPASILTYTDAMNLMRAKQAKRQALVALTQAKIEPQKTGERAFYSNGLITTSDFFPMFGTPFKYGTGWTSKDDSSASHVAVIAGFLNDKLFNGDNSVGRTIRVNDHDYRIIGVLKPWAPQPHFYALQLGGRGYGDGDAVFLPLRSARADDMGPQSISCYAAGDIDKLEASPCMWLGMWVELASASDVSNYRRFLTNYVDQQVSAGRFHRPETALLDLMGWLDYQQVVPDDVRLQAGLAFGFLLICVVNTVGLLLAKCLRRSREIGVRRALGATRSAIFAQFMMEAAIVGLAGGLLGLFFAELGLWGIRHQPAEYADLAQLDFFDVCFHFCGGFNGQPDRRAVACLARLCRRPCSPTQGRLIWTFRFVPFLPACAKHRIPAVLIVLEIALACAVLCNAVFMIGTRVASIHARDAIDESNLSVITLFGSNPKLVQSDTPRNLEALRHISGVQSAAVMNGVPVSSSGWNSNFSTTEKSGKNGDYGPDVAQYFLGVGAPKVLGLQLEQGRLFTPDEYANGTLGNSYLAQQHVVVVTQSLADRMWPGAVAFRQKNVRGIILVHRGGCGGRRAASKRPGSWHQQLLLQRVLSCAA